MSNYDCSLDGARLASLDESICILDICEDAPKLRLSTIPLPGGGQRVLSKVRESLSVHIFFAIQEPDAARRRDIFHTVLTWAEQGGILTISTRAGQQLPVVCTDTPAIHAEDWTESLQLTFTTTSSPYWEAIASTQIDLNKTITATLPGNGIAIPAAVMAVNTSGSTVTQLTLCCGDTRMTFEDFSLPAGGLFTLWQSENIVHALIDQEDALRYRTADSDDLLLLPCGKECQISITADHPVDAAMTVRGRYL